MLARVSRALAVPQQLLSMCRLPPRVAWFYVRALGVAIRCGDRWSPRSAVRPRELASLLRHARGRRRVVELGTGAAWTAIALALADPRRAVVTYDPVPRAQRERYLGLVGVDVRRRIELRDEPGEAGPAEGPAPDFVFVDSQHEREATLDAFRVWEPALEPGGAIVFHDYGNSRWPGVADAVAALGLTGAAEPLLFVWEKPS